MDKPQPRKFWDYQDIKPYIAHKLNTSSEQISRTLRAVFEDSIQCNGCRVHLDDEILDVLEDPVEREVVNAILTEFAEPDPFNREVEIYYWW